MRHSPLAYTRRLPRILLSHETVLAINHSATTCLKRKTAMAELIELYVLIRIEESPQLDGVKAPWPLERDLLVPL